MKKYDVLDEKGLMFKVNGKLTNYNVGTKVPETLFKRPEQIDFLIKQKRIKLSSGKSKAAPAVKNKKQPEAENKIHITGTDDLEGKK